MGYHSSITELRFGAKKIKLSAVSLADLDSEEGILRYLCLKSLEERGISGSSAGSKVIETERARRSDLHNYYYHLMAV